ncbi:hypothetical protein, partial [Pseudomonas aeruginosa]|uniref:hypothetical protein n=1 Tax=Pseudomonas aeruginosa TaxID=287 RepID=UPI001C8C5F12
SDRPSCARTARSIEARDTHTWVISARGGFRVADTTEPREGAPVVRSALEKITLSDMIEQRSGRIPRALYDLLLNPQSLLQSSNLGLKTGNARALGQKVIARMLNSTASRTVMGGRLQPVGQIVREVAELNEHRITSVFW